MSRPKRLAAALALVLVVVPVWGREDPGPPDVAPEAARWASLVPLPVTTAREPGLWALPDDLAVSWVGPDLPDAREQASFFERLTLLTGALDRGWHLTPPGRKADLRVSTQGPGDGGYRLSVRPEGVVVEASTPQGRYAALTTLTQLLPPWAAPGQPARAAAGTVDDAPRFSWRGLMVDSARHFLPAADLRQVLEWMALHKLNRFHWHLTDDQGWRFPVPGWPRLTEVGAWREEVDGTFHGGFYTEDEIRSLVEYAARRHITIVPEVDLPGHSSAALASYPDLSALGVPRQVPVDWGIADGVVSVGRASVDRFTDAVLAQLVRLFPGPWIHWGGDEVFRSPFLRNAESQAWMRKVRAGTPEEAVAAFWNALAAKTLAAGRTPVGWDDTALHRPPAGTVIQWWDDPSRASLALADGHPVILSWKEAAYLDYPEVEGEGDRAWWMPVTDAGQVLRLPLLPTGAPAGAGRLVLGLEATLFSERVSPGKLGRKLFPRLALIAELAWRGDPGGTPGWANRLADHRSRLEAWGVGMPPPAR